MNLQFPTTAFFFLVALTACQYQHGMDGKWTSEYPERSVSGVFGVRQFSFNDQHWEVKASVYLDSAKTLPVFTFRAVGEFTLGKKSVTVPGAREAVFGFDRKYITLETKDTGLIRKYGLDRCNLTHLEEKDITDEGCIFFPSKALCAREFDLVRVSGNLLYLGARPASGGMCEDARRPVALGLPLKRVE